MKVILLQDVAKVGKKYDIKDVSDGFASNSLIPRGLAEFASPIAVSSIEALKAKEEQDKALHGEKLKEKLATLKELTVAFSLPANEKGHLFKGVTAEMISKALHEQHGISLDADVLGLEKPIKEVGDHAVSVEVSGGKGSVAVKIEAAE